MGDSKIKLYGSIYDENLLELDLYNDYITQICIEIGRLRNLRELYFNDNQICIEIGRLRNLRELYFNDNQIIK